MTASSSLLDLPLDAGVDPQEFLQAAMEWHFNPQTGSTYRLKRANIELGFPCVWVAPWTREAGIVPLKHTLVLTAVTKDEKLVDDLLADSTIKNLYIGNHPTYWMASGIPHDGYLGAFLMRSKAVIRD